MSANGRLILLIDGENLDSKYAGAIRAKVAELGTMIEGRVYGKADNGRMAGWKKSPDAAGLKMINVEETSKQKNAADFQLVVDAMDVLHTRHLDILCIGSSDGDFSALARRVTAQTLTLYGFGEKKAPAKYQKICDEFFDCAMLLAEAKTATRKKAPLQAATVPKAAALPRTAPRPAEAAKPAMQPTARARHLQQPAGTSARSAQPVRPEIPPHIVQAILKIVRAHDGDATYRDIGNALPKEIKGFKSRTHGFGTTKAMLRTLDGKHGLATTREGHVVLALT